MLLSANTTSSVAACDFVCERLGVTSRATHYQHKCQSQRRCFTAPGAMYAVVVDSLQLQHVTSPLHPAAPPPPLGGAHLSVSDVHCGPCT